MNKAYSFLNKPIVVSKKGKEKQKDLNKERTIAFHYWAEGKDTRFKKYKRDYIIYPTTIKVKRKKNNKSTQAKKYQVLAFDELGKAPLMLKEMCAQYFFSVIVKLSNTYDELNEKREKFKEEYNFRKSFKLRLKAEKTKKL